MRQAFSLIAGPLLAASVSTAAMAQESASEFQPEGQCFDYLPKGNMPETLPENDPFSIIYQLRDAGTEESKAQMKALAVSVAQGAVKYAYGDAPSSLQNAASELNSMLDRLPEASASERQKINERAYDIRINLERRGFKYDYVQAAQSVVAASLSASEINLHGHDQSIISGDPEWVSLYAAMDALEGTIVFDNLGSEREMKKQGAEFVMAQIEALQSGCAELDLESLTIADDGFIAPWDVEDWARDVAEQKNHIEARQIVADAAQDLGL